MNHRDTLVVVGHGSSTEIGTSGEQQSYSPDRFAGLLEEMGIPKGARVFLAACDTTAFATSLKQKLDDVEVIGQEGGFMFPTQMPLL